MSLLGLGEDPAPFSVRAGVLGACLAIAVSFGLSIELAAQPITTAETVESADVD